jgi:hypothetical protein
MAIRTVLFFHHEKDNVMLSRLNARNLFIVKTFRPRLRATWVCTMIAFVAQVAAFDRFSMAGFLVLQSSNITATFVGDTNLPNTSTANSRDGSLRHSFGYNGLASGYASVTTVSGQDFAAFRILAGTGGARTDPLDQITGATTLNIDFTATWKVVGSPFGPVFNVANLVIEAKLEPVGDEGYFEFTFDYGDGTSLNRSLTFNQSGIGQIDYNERSNAPVYQVGDIYSLSGSTFFSFKGNSIESTSLYQDGGVSSVPEPSSVILTVIGGLSLLGIARGRLGAGRRLAESVFQIPVLRRIKPE